MQIGFRALQLRVCGFVLTTNTAEQIELPRRIESRVVEFGGVGNTDRTRRRRHLLLRVATGSGDPRTEVEQRLTTNGTRFDKSAERNAQVMIGVQCIVHEVIQGFIAELRPELRLDLLSRVGRRFRADKRGSRRGVGLHIVGADRAGRKGGGDDCRQDSCGVIRIRHGSPPGPPAGP